MFAYVKNEFNNNPVMAVVPDDKFDDNFHYVFYDKSPAININCSWTNYFNKRSRKTRYNLRRCERLLEENLGPVEFVTTKDPSEISIWMPVVHEMYKRRWKGLWNRSPFVSRRGLVAYERAARELASTNRFELNLLLVNGELLSFAYCLIDGGVYSMYLHAVAPEIEFRKFSIGKIFLCRLLKHVFDNKYKEFDFMIGLDSYKSEWSNMCKDVYLKINRGNHFVDKCVSFIWLIVIKSRVWCRNFLYKNSILS